MGSRQGSSEGARFTAAIAEARRCAYDVRHFKELSKTKATQLVAERNSLSVRKQWLREIDEDVRSKTMILQSSGDASLQRQLDMELQHVDRELKDALQRLEKIKLALGHITQIGSIKSLLPQHQARAIDAAREALNLLQDGGRPETALKMKGERVQALQDEIASLRSLEAFLHESGDRLASEIRILQSDVERLEAATAGGQYAILSNPVTRLLGALDKKGMAPSPFAMSSRLLSSIGRKPLNHC